MKIRYQDIKRLSNEMLGNVANMERYLMDFKKRTQSFASVIQDSISEQAIALVEELTRTVKDLRSAIEKGASTVLEGAEKLGMTEKRRSGDIGRI